MAKEPRRRESISTLKSEIAGSREQVTHDLRGLRYELDIPRKIRRSFREHTAIWTGAAIAVGALLVLMPMRRRKVDVDLARGKNGKPERKFLEAGFLLGLLRLAAPLLRPMVTKFVAQKVRNRPHSVSW